MNSSFVNKKWFLSFIVIIVAFFISITCIIFFNHNYISAPMQDIEYKKAIIRDSHNPFYKLESLRPLVGETELIEFIKQNDSNPQIYVPSEKNIRKGIYRANLHTHTNNSDGNPTVEERLEEAQEYAAKRIKDGYMYLAITDHNTVLGAQEVIKALQKNAGKYKNIKVVAGLEIYTRFHNSALSEKPTDIHVLLWCINPYDEFLNQEFYKADLNDKWNWKERDFDETIKTMSEYGLVGVAHPARYTAHLNDNKQKHIENMFDRYAANSNKPLFTEGYYQVYKGREIEKVMGDKFGAYLDFINEQAEKRNIIRTGSTDAHGPSIFK